MIRILFILWLALLICAPSTAQVGQSARKRSIYADDVFRVLVQASQLAAERQNAMMRRSSLEEHETAEIRKSSTMTVANQKQLDRLSQFGGDRMKRLELLSEFREDEIARMQAEFKPRLPKQGDPGQLADAADRNSNMTRPEIQLLLKGSDDRDWARRVRETAVAAGDFSAMLSRRSLHSATSQSLILDLSVDK